MYDNYQLPRGSIRLIYAGTDTQRVDNALAQPRGHLHKLCHLPSEIPIVIFVGRMTDQKRPGLFVQSVAKIFSLQSECKAHFAMIGDGVLKAYVANLVSRLALGNRVHLLGAHPNAMELIADASLLMMPSAYEGLALVSYEAMGLGIPQIFAAVNGQPEL